MSITDLELAAADLVARLDDREVADVAEQAASDFVRGAATVEKVRRERTKKVRRRSAA